MLGVTFAELNKALRLPPFSLLLVALAIVDGTQTTTMSHGASLTRTLGMTLSFFYQVKDTGSWLEIGQSISFFCITSLLLLWAAIICAIGEYLMTGTTPAVPTARAE